jgi:hypothetical protein
MLTKGGNENPVSGSFGAEEDSRMRRSDLAGLTGFAAVAGNLSFRAAAARLGVTPSALGRTMPQLGERLCACRTARHAAYRRPTPDGVCSSDWGR